MASTVKTIILEYTGVEQWFLHSSMDGWFHSKYQRSERVPPECNLKKPWRFFFLHFLQNWPANYLDPCHGCRAATFSLNSHRVVMHWSIHLLTLDARMVWYQMHSYLWHWKHLHNICGIVARNEVMLLPPFVQGKARTLFSAGDTGLSSLWFFCTVQLGTNKKKEMMGHSLH